MTARYEERQVGVFDRIAQAEVLPRTDAWAEYQRYLAETGEQPDPMPAPAPPSLAQALAEKIALIENLAGEIRRGVTARASPPEMASWTMKAQQAQSFLASSNPTDAPLLLAEAKARGASIESIVARVMNNAATLLQAEALIAGVAGKHKDAVRGLKDAQAVLAYDFEGGWEPYWPLSSAPVA